MRPEATTVCGLNLKLLVYAALSDYWWMRSEAASVYAVLCYLCIRPCAARVLGLKLRLHATVSY